MVVYTFNLCSPEHTPDLTPSPSVTSSPSLLPPTDNHALDLVIAHCNESLSWLGPYAPFATVYSKGEPPQGLEQDPQIYREVKLLPNFGRESHTYLYHIVTKYDELADVTVFLQGSIHDEKDGTPAHTDLTLHEIVGMARNLSDVPPLLLIEGLCNQDDQPEGGIHPIGKVHAFSDWQGIQYLPGWIERRGQGLRRSALSPEQFWNHIITGATSARDSAWEAPPSEIPWTQGALFAVTRETIQRHPKEVYLRAYEYFDTLAENNPEEGHYMERFWLALFSHGFTAGPS